VFSLKTNRIVACENAIYDSIANHVRLNELENTDFSQLRVTVLIPSVAKNAAPLIRRAIKYILDINPAD
jgi:hypothetical protein